MNPNNQINNQPLSTDISAPTEDNTNSSSLKYIRWAIITLASIAIIVGSVVYLIAVFKSHIKPKETLSSESKNLKNESSIYEDDYIRFSYPATWTANKQYNFSDSYGALLININAPADVSLKAKDISVSNVFFVASVIIGKNERFTNGRRCENACKVSYVTQALTKNPVINGNLVVSDWDNKGFPYMVNYTSDTVNIDQKGYKFGFSIGENYFASVRGTLVNEKGEPVRLRYDDDFLKSDYFKELQKIVQSVDISIDKLPK